MLAVGAAAIFAGVSSLGLDDAMTRYVAIQSGRRDHAGVWGTIQLGLVGAAVAGIGIGAVLFLASEPIATGLFDEPRLATLLKIVAILVPFLTVSNVLAGTARGFRKMEYVALAENVVQSLVRLVLIVLVALVTRGLDVIAATLVFAISDLAATATFVVLLRRHFVAEAQSVPRARREVKEVFRFALPLWIASLLRQSRRNFETVMLGATRAASSVGVYSVVNKVNLVGHVWLLSIFAAVKPTLARLHDRRDTGGLGHLYTTVTRWSLTLTLPFFLVMVLYREPILAVFGPSFAAVGTTALVLLAIAELVNAGTGICGSMIEMTGHTRVKVANSVILTTLLISTNAVLIPRWGVVGAATASLVGISIFNVLSVVEVLILEGLFPFDRTFWKPVTAGVGAFLGGTVLMWVQPVGRSVPLAAAEGLAVLGGFLALLVMLGVPDEDRLVVDRVLGRASRLLRRRSAGTAVAAGNPIARAASDVAADAARDPAADPICIGGLDRSGKTTMAAFLTSHPRIAIPPVGSNLWTYFYGQFGDLARPENLERCLAAMLRYRHVQVLDPDPDRIRRELAAGPPTYARLFSLFLRHYAERQGKPRWGEQTGLVERYADEIFTAFPGARIVHLVRDPRDRYQGSLELWPNGRGRAGGATARWTYSTRLARRNQRKYPDGYLVVRYEDMVLHTEATLREVCAFVGEEYDPVMLSMAAAPERRERLMSRAAEPRAGTPLTAEYIGRYRESVPVPEVAFMQMHARRLMRRYGYAPDPIDLSPREWARFVTIGWPSQAARMVAWRGMEHVQQRLPRLAGRKPDRRLVVDTSAGGPR